MAEMNPQVEQYLREVKQWQPELTELRKIVLEAGLTEELKWRSPCYTHNKKNIAILGGFKEHCVLSFFQGALLTDPKKVLVKPGENTRAARVIPFTCVPEIFQLKTTIHAYLREAIELEKAGQKVDLAEDAAQPMPVELEARLESDPVLRTAFEALTPGRQRGYLLHFGGAKQSKSREARIEKCVSRILAGKGLRDCTCGLSKRMPNCDGSHKQLG